MKNAAEIRQAAEKLLAGAKGSVKDAPPGYVLVRHEDLVSLARAVRGEQEG